MMVWSISENKKCQNGPEDQMIIKLVLYKKVWASVALIDMKLVWAFHEMEHMIIINSMPRCSKPEEYQYINHIQVPSLFIWPTQNKSQQNTAMFSSSLVHLNIRTMFPRYRDSHVKDCIFNMGIAILVRQHVYIETAPLSSYLSSICLKYVWLLFNLFLPHLA